MTRRKRTLSSLLQLIQDKFLTEAKKGVASRRLNQEAQVSRRMTSDNVEDGGGVWIKTIHYLSNYYFLLLSEMAP